VGYFTQAKALGMRGTRLPKVLLTPVVSSKVYGFFCADYRAIWVLLTLVGSPNICGFKVYMEALAVKGAS